MYSEQNKGYKKGRYLLHTFCCLPRIKWRWQKSHILSGKSFNKNVFAVAGCKNFEPGKIFEPLEFLPFHPFSLNNINFSSITLFIFFG
jgi:hypothetical protein